MCSVVSSMKTADQGEVLERTQLGRGRYEHRRARRASHWYVKETCWVFRGSTYGHVAERSKAVEMHFTNVSGTNIAKRSNGRKVAER